MTKTFLLSTVAAAFLLATPASAQSQETQTRTNIKTRGDAAAYVDRPAHVEEVTKDDIKRTVKKAEQKIENAANKITQKTDKPVAAAGTLAITEANIAENASAENMIGKAVLDGTGERVGSVHDIILTNDGKAATLIVADGGKLSVGDKKAAFDYKAVSGRDEKGALKTTITEDQITNAKAFSYDMNDKADDKTQVMAAGSLSVRDVIGAKLLNEEGKAVGSIKDIELDDDRVGKVIIAYDQFLGLGGKKVGLPFQQLVKTDADSGQTNFRLDSQMAAQLNGYNKKTVN